MDEQIEQTAEITLRDQIAANLETATEPEEAGVTDDGVIGETAEQRADRLRDEKGRFAKSDGNSEEKQDAKAEVTAKPGDLAPPQTTEKPKLQRPSTWKKDHWEAYDKLAAENPALAEYINQRESEYAKGVSTYKQEAERAKELWGALEPFMPDLQANNIQPSQWIQNLGRAHQTLALGSPMQKLQMFQRLAQDYGVPLQALMPQQQAQQPMVDANGQPMQQGLQQHGLPVEQIMPLVNPLYEQVNQLRGQIQNWQTQQQQEMQKQIDAEIQRFSADKPHFEQVKSTMSRLLETGLAQDLQEAHDMAIRMPQHDDIFQAMQQQQREESDRKAAEERRAAAERARKQTVSTRSTTPQQGKDSKGNGSGLRALIAENVESVMGGRV